jgi:hypothetical protein
MSQRQSGWTAGVFGDDGGLSQGQLPRTLKQLSIKFLMYSHASLLA